MDGGDRGGDAGCCNVYRGGVRRACLALVACAVCHTGGVTDGLRVGEGACIGVSPRSARDVGIAQIGSAVIHAHGLAAGKCRAQGAAGDQRCVVGVATIHHSACDEADVVGDGRDLCCGDRCCCVDGDAVGGACGTLVTRNICHTRGVADGCAMGQCAGVGKGPRGARVCGQP